MSLVLTTLKNLASAHDEADRYRVSVDLMKYAAPAEIRILVENSTIEPGPFRSWLHDLDANVVLNRSTYAAFKHARLAEGVSLYSNGEGSKTLVMGFCGQAHFLCVPTPVLLQYFPEDSFDFLVLRDPERKGFSTGSLGYARSFPELVQRLRSELNVGRYRDVRCFGVSSGGAPALAAGVILGASKLVSFCGRPPTVSQSYGDTAASIAIENCLKESRVENGRAFAVFGADNRTDSGNARSLARLLNIKLMPIRASADHNVITPLHQRGELGAMFQAVGLL